MRSSTVEAGLAQRARIVLLAARGVPNAQIARRVGVSRPTVIQWRNRYEAGGISALGDLDRSGRPPVIDDVAVVVATVQAPPEALGVTHWSARLLGKHLGISFASVARIWREWNLQPWRRETFKFSTDPELDAKVRDVVGLYKFFILSTGHSTTGLDVIVEPTAAQHDPAPPGCLRPAHSPSDFRVRTSTAGYPVSLVFAEACGLLSGQQTKQARPMRFLARDRVP